MSLSVIGSRLAALALAGGLCALLLLGGVVPFAGVLASLDEDVGIAASAVGRLQARIADREGFAERLADLEREIAASDMHITAETPAIGAAVMQQLLAEAAARAGVQVASVQVLPDGPEGGFRRIALRGEFWGPLPGVMSLLHELESGRPYIFIDALEFRARSDAAADPGEHPVLSVRADLLAYMTDPKG